MNKFNAQFSHFKAQIDACIRNVPDYPKEGIIFKDITPLLGNYEMRKLATILMMNQIKEKFGNSKIDAVAGIESRGFLFGTAIADALEVPFIPIRKIGKLPYKKIQKSYDLEYGSATIEMHEDAVQPGQRILIHDDLLATGGTVIASEELIKEIGGTVVGFSFLIELAFLKGREKVEQNGSPVLSLLQY